VCGIAGGCGFFFVGGAAGLIVSRPNAKKPLTTHIAKGFSFTGRR
jgi:hypothetical protein